MAKYKVEISGSNALSLILLTNEENLKLLKNV